MEGSTPTSGRPFAGAATSGHPPRRLSYASVASGATSSTSVPPARAGALAHLAATTSPNPSHPHYPADPRYTQGPSGSDRGAASQSSTKHNTETMEVLPACSRQYANVRKGGQTDYFIPSYLDKSRYASKLRAAYAAKPPASKCRSSSTVSIGTGSGAPNVHRLAPSHRGMTYDIIESNPPKEEDVIAQLPTRWSSQDKHPGLEIANLGLEVKYSGSTGKADTEAASVRADFPMPRECGIYYFEVEIKQKSKDCAVAVGFSTQKASLERLPGWEAESWAYHGDDGKAFSGEHQGKHYSDHFAAGDTVGCGVNFVNGTAFFTKNGVDAGLAFKDLKNIQPFPSIGIKKYSGVIVSVNFGQAPFVYDIDERVEKERDIIRREIKKTKTSLHSGMSEHSLIQGLVAQLLSNGGYVETAKAFSQERRSEQNGARSLASRSADMTSLESTYAVYRQQIRNAVLNGNIDQALDLTNLHFPTILPNSPEIVFRLKCRKWVELIGKASDLRNRQKAIVGRLQSSSNGVGDIFDQRMDVDDDQQQSIGNTKVTATDADTDTAYNQLLTEAVAYGQILQREYREEPNPEYRKALDTIFSLVAYDDPRSSVHGHVLDNGGRVKVAEELNGAILVSLGKSPTAAVEKMYRQTEALIDILSRSGGSAAFVNLRTEFRL